MSAALPASMLSTNFNQKRTSESTTPSLPLAGPAKIHPCKEAPKEYKDRKAREAADKLAYEERRARRERYTAGEKAFLERYTKRKAAWEEMCEKN